MIKMNKKTIRILQVSVTLASIIGLSFIGYIHYFFLAKPFQMSETAYEHYKNKFTAEKMTKQLEAIYEAETLKRKGK